MSEVCVVGVRPTALVTGAGSGVGFDAARSLLVEGYRVVLHSRTGEQGRAAVERLARAGADRSVIHPVAADFTRLDEVILMGRQIATDHPGLEVVVNAAAVVGTDQCVLTEDGNEVVLQVNYLAPYLLIRTLQAAIAAAGNPRVVNLSSALHRGASVRWKDVNRVRGYTAFTAFAQSKLALTMFTAALAEADAMTAVSVDPGSADPRVLRLHGSLVPPVHDGGEILARLGSSGSEVVNGAFYDRLIPAQPALQVIDRRATERLLRLSSQLTGAS
jgi:NAD(P)-dependent dehydrogenase (short-subunit alcohol dehydrogenase family)